MPIEWDVLLISIIYHHKSQNHVNFCNQLDRNLFTRDHEYSEFIGKDPIGVSYIQRLYENRMVIISEIIKLLFLFDISFSSDEVEQIKLRTNNLLHPEKMDFILKNVKKNMISFKKVKKDKLERSEYLPPNIIKKCLLTKGILNFCDYSSSNLELNKDDLIFKTTPQISLLDYLKIKNSANKFNIVQEHIENTPKDDISKFNYFFIEAPTGFGKTESSILISLKIQSLEENNRVFYCLPFAASINKMYKRFSDPINNDLKNPSLFEKRQVEIYHHRADEFRYDEIFEKNRPFLRFYKESKILDFNDQKKGFNIDLKEKTLSPVRILTPFQLIKNLYGIGPYEKNLFESLGSLIIFDEIDSYDMETLVRILGIIYFYYYYCDCKFLFMSASFPLWLKWVIIEILRKCESEKNRNEIDPNIFLKYEDYISWKKQRVNQKKLPDNEFMVSDEILRKKIHHKIAIHKGTLLDYIRNNTDEFVQRGKDSKVLIVFNTVDESVLAYQEINKHMKDSDSLDIILIHSRFTFSDRNEIENRIEIQNKKNSGILIGTQTIEVSLDIDYNYCFSEPAPIDRIIQRMGRVFRRRLLFTKQENKKLSEFSPNVMIFEKQSSKASIYDKEIVQETLKILKDQILLNKGILSELRKKALIEEVYKDYAKNRIKFLNQKISNQFDYWLRRLVPGNKALREEKWYFYKLFNSIEVVPHSLFSIYSDFIEEGKYLEASRLELSLTYYPKDLTYQKIISKYKLREGKIEKFNDKVLITKEDDWKYSKICGLIRASKIIET